MLGGGIGRVPLDCHDVFFLRENKSFGKVQKMALAQVVEECLVFVVGKKVLKQTGSAKGCLVGPYILRCMVIGQTSFFLFIFMKGSYIIFTV